MLPVGIGRERAPCWWRVWEVLGICALTLLCSSGSGIDGGDSGALRLACPTPEEPTYLSG
jgi:hypothetical protein